MTEAQPEFFRDMENALLTEFCKKADRRFRELHAAGKQHPYVIGTALCGQDKALADSLFAAGGRFALIEFKANAGRLKTEGGKPQRLRLLESCVTDSARLSRSRAIHHAAWGVPVQLDLPGLGSQTDLDLVLAPYVDKIGAVLGVDIPRMQTRSWTTDAFLRTYLESRVTGDNVRRFKRYLMELYELVGIEGAAGLAGFQGLITVYVPAREPTFQAITFNSFQHLMELTIHYQPQREHALARDKAAPAMPRQRGPKPDRERGGPER